MIQGVFCRYSAKGSLNKLPKTPLPISELAEIAPKDTARQKKRI